MRSRHVAGRKGQFRKRDGLQSLRPTGAPLMPSSLRYRGTTGTRLANKVSTMKLKQNGGDQRMAGALARHEKSQSICIVVGP